MRRRNSFLLALVASIMASLGCDEPTQYNPDRYGRVTVFFASDWLPVDRPRLRQTLVNLNALGPSFVEVETGSTADVIVRPFLSPGCASVGQHTIGTRVALVDPNCTPGDTVFRAVLAHEIGHVLGMGHICRVDAEVAGCSPVGIGSALMNPYIWESSDPLQPLVPREVPSDLDLAEFRRVRSRDAGR